jgi:uncharacterized protein with GYD domain
MPNYIILLRLTDEGIKNIKGAPERVEEGIKSFEAMGGKVTGFYVTMGEYDYVAVGEAPNDETLMRFLFGLRSLGNVRSTTLKAWTKEAYAEMLKELP